MREKFRGNGDSTRIQQVLLFFFRHKNPAKKIFCFGIKNEQKKVWGVGKSNRQNPDRRRMRGEWERVSKRRWPICEWCWGGGGWSWGFYCQFLSLFFFLGTFFFVVVLFIGCWWCPWMILNNNAVLLHYNVCAGNNNNSQAHRKIC